ncbi:MAG TPA: TRAP transporter TatT component family protein [Vicinamibacterales bacterium]
MVLAGAPVAAQAPADRPGSVPEADALYARREEPGQARAAADLWARALEADPTNFEAAWKLAKARYWLGTHGPEAQRRADLEAGIEAARKAIALRPRSPEGHFWLAANMGALAESFGLRQGIKYRKPIKAALEEVLRIDPAYEQGSADRALGRWYFKVPGLFGGSNEKSEAHLRRALEYNPQSTVTWFFLAETLLDMGRKDEAREALQRVLDAPVSEDWGPEDREWKKKASELLASLEARKR